MDYRGKICIIMDVIFAHEPKTSHYHTQTIFFINIQTVVGTLHVITISLEKQIGMLWVSITRTGTVTYPNLK